MMAGFEDAPLRRGGCPWSDRAVGALGACCWCWRSAEAGVTGAAAGAAVVNRRTLPGAAWLQMGLATWPGTEAVPESAVLACRKLDVTRRDFMFETLVLCVCACQEVPVDELFCSAQKESGLTVGSSVPRRRHRIGLWRKESVIMDAGQPVPAPSLISNAGLQIGRFGVFRHFTCSLGIAHDWGCF